MKKYILAVLAFCMIQGAACGMVFGAQEAETSASWEMNELKEDHGAAEPMEESGEVSSPTETAFGVPQWYRSMIKGVYVLDSLADMPADAVDLSASEDGSVMGWLDEGDNLYIAGEGGVKAPENAAALFGWYQNAEVIDLGGNLHTEDTTDFRFMFYHDYNARQINITGMDTAKGTTFSKMFAYCKCAEELDLSSFDTSSAESFYQMFIHCDALKKLDLTAFRAGNARTIALMFYECGKLEEIVFSRENFNTSGIKRMTDLFLGCESLSSLDIGWFDMSSVQSVKNMFMRCKSLPYMDLSGWDLSSVKNHKGMFAGSSLELNYGKNGEYFFRDEANS